MTPSGIARRMATIVAMIASWSESANRSLISSEIGAPVNIKVPKSSRTIPPIQPRTCCQMGLSSPRRARPLSRVSFDAYALSPAKRSSTMSPGTIRIRKKMSTATPKSVGIISKRRLMMYLVTVARPLFREPHAVELVVDEVAGCDGPPVHPGAVRDDPVPLQRIEVVRLLVQEPPLELAHPLLALLGVQRAAPLLVEIIERLVDVAAVVVAADAHRLELVEVEIRVDRVAALRVDGDLVVAVPQVGLPLGRLDEFVARRESD